MDLSTALLPRLRTGSWGLRDYGTGLWEGGDDGCDHVERTGGKQAPVGANTLGRDASHPYRETLPTTGHALIETRYRDVCGKCGATRKDQQLGLEPSPDLYVEAMVGVFREVRRVLAAHGTCWVNLGDSYAGSWGAQSREKLAEPDARSDRPKERGGPCSDTAASGSASLSSNQIAAHPKRTHTGSWVNDHATLKPKDLVGIPWRVAFALQADGWFLRSDIVWSKPNPMPESVTDRPTKAHEYVFLLTKSPRYHFDQEAVRERALWTRENNPDWNAQRAETNARKHPTNRNGQSDGFVGWTSEQGRNIRSVWSIATQPYPGAHFAVFPEALVDRCIRAGTSERGHCPQCRAPSKRVEKSLAPTGWRPTCSHYDDLYQRDFPKPRGRWQLMTWPDRVRQRPIPERFAWSTAPAVVFDPFTGSGTTALVARRLGRHAVGIELNADYAEQCAERLQQLSLFAG